GEIMKTRCSNCDSISEINEAFLKAPGSSFIPECSECGGMLRPAVVWFGESLDQNTLVSSYQRLRVTDLLIIAGTSAVVYPVADFPSFAKRHNSIVKILEFNLEITPISKIASKTFFGSIENTLGDFFTNYGDFS
ncbi:MAG: SIR2 family NAD-dependent protein deacylase, partial [Candidatus Hodarchaeales archaeon]